MTELYIDGYPVSLGEDFLIDFYSKNPFFTKDGEFTYDIDIDLKSPSNERVYKHIQRTHNDIRPKGRSAAIVVDGRILTWGTEIVLNIEDKAKIQIVSGNSELNYLSGGNKKIKDLDLGAIEANITNDMALSSLSGKYPEWNFVCAPVLKEYTKYPFNSPSAYFNAEMFNKISRDVINGLKFKSNTEFVPQPYLLYYVEKVCEALGYNVVENCLLNDPRNLEHIVVNGIKTLNYNEMIPNWEVDKFLTEIEKYFNIVFLVNKMDKTIRIQYIYDYYNTSETIYISKDQLIDIPEKKYDVNDNLDFLYKNIKYNLPSSTWYNQSCLDSDLKKMCTVHLYNDFDAIKPFLEDGRAYNLLRFYKTRDNGNQYVMKRINVSSTPGATNYLYYFELADSFKNITDESSENETSLNIVPAEVMALKLTGYVYVESEEKERTLRYYSTVPYCRNIPSTEEKTNGNEEKDGLNEFIENGVPEESIPDKIFVALYKGIRPCLYSGSYYPEAYKKLTYPMSLVFPYVVIMTTEIGTGTGTFMINELFKPGSDDDDLSLEYRNKNNYSKNMDVDTSTEHIFRIITNKVYNPKSKFVIDNKKFYCKELHYTVESKGLNKIVEGTFYPM